MEIDEKLIYELLEWCVKNIPETKEYYVIDSLYRDDFINDIKCIDSKDPEFLSIIVFHLSGMVEKYFNMRGTKLWIYGISIDGQDCLDKLRNKYSPKELVS